MKIALISPSARHLETLNLFLRDDAAPRTISLVEGGMSKLRVVADQQRPDLVIVDGMCHSLDELAPLEYVTINHPHVMVLMLCSNQTPEFLLSAMRAGVKEVLPAPATQETLLAAVERAEARLSGKARRRQPGKVLAFISCKGGSGATFLATNLGYQLAIESKKVLLIDFNLQFGDAVLFVHDKKPTTHFADLARNIARLDASFLAASLVHVTPDYGILAAPEDPAEAMEIKPDHVDVLLDLAVNHYDFVIIDVGRVLDAVTLRALDKASHIFPVLQMTLPFIRDANRLLAVFRSLGYSPEKISLLINRFEKAGDFGLADVERTLGVSSMRTIPNSYAAVASSVNRGVPIARFAKSNPVTRSLGEFAQALLPRAEESGGWLGRLIKRT